MDHESFYEPKEPMDGMGIGERTRCFQQIWSNHLLRLKRERRKRAGLRFHRECRQQGGRPHEGDA